MERPRQFCVTPDIGRPGPAGTAVQECPVRLNIGCIAHADCGLPMIELAQDLRYAVRSLSRSKTLAATAIISLALGIGANTAIFSLVNAILLRRLPVPNPSQLVQLYTLGAGGRNRQSFSWPMFEQIRSTQQVFSGVFAWFESPLENFEANGVKYAAQWNGVSGEYFPTLGVQPLLGRLITSEDFSTRAQVAVLSYGAWQGHYAADRNVIGKTIRIGGRPMTIIGITPKAFAGMNVDYGFEAAVPMSSRAGTLTSRTDRIYCIIGRLKPGVSVARASLAMRTLWPSIQTATVPEGYHGQQADAFFARQIDADSASVGDSYLRERQSHSLLLIMALVGAVLLIACVNLATLMLVRAASLERETCVRIALGAGRWQFTRRWVAESLVLSSAGAAVGLVLAFWTTPVLLRLMFAGFVPYAIDPIPDARVLEFTLALTVLTALIFGIAPAWNAAAANPAEALQRGSTRVHAGAGLGARVLVSAQIALSMVLVTSAGLLLRSLNNMRTADLGFRRDHVLTMQLFPQAGSGHIPDRTAYYHDLAEKLRQIPGVQSVSYSNAGPVSRSEYPYNITGPSSSTDAMLEVAGPSFFDLLGMRVLSGREFDWHDDQASPRVCVISESLARNLFPNQNPIGHELNVPEFPAKGLQVVGVVNSASLWLVRHREPQAIYLPFLQQPAYNTPLVEMRTSGDPLRSGREAERTLESLGHHFSLRTQSVEQRADLFLAEDRTIAVLASSLAVMALFLAGIGLYGVISHTAGRRVPEIGIRMAVGASRTDIFHLIVREALWLVVAGLAVGIPAILVVRRFIGSLLFGVGANDPGTLIASLLLLLAVATLAGFLPARRAMRVDPMTALRTE
jgi:putative ABC transport system permease protein